MNKYLRFRKAFGKIKQKIRNCKGKEMRFDELE